MKTPPLTTHDIAGEHALPVWKVRRRARELGLGELHGRELRFTRAEARQIVQHQPKRGRPIKHGLYVGWRDPERRKKAAARLRRIAKATDSR